MPTTNTPTTQQHWLESAGGYFSGIIMLHGTQHRVITAPADQGQFKGQWLPEYDDVPGARSFFDSAANTRAMAEAGSVIAQRALAANINGFTDWVIPARDVLEVMYRAHKPTTDKNWIYRGDNPSSVPVGYPYTADAPARTADKDFQKGGAQAFLSDLYWSSTQCSSDDAWIQTFRNGDQHYGRKDFELQVRLARLIPL